MTILKAIKSLGMKDCAVLIGADVDILSAALFNKLALENIVLFQVSHKEGTNQPDIVSESANMVKIRLDISSLDALNHFFVMLTRKKFQPKLVIFSPALSEAMPTLSITPTQIEKAWQQSGYSAFFVAQAALKAMHKINEGTLLFLGSALATKPIVPYLASSAMHAGIRALAQSLAREFNPQGIHVAYIAVPHHIEQLSAEKLSAGIAKSCWHAHKQSKYTWTQEFSSF